MAPAVRGGPPSTRNVRVKQIVPGDDSALASSASPATSISMRNVTIHPEDVAGSHDVPSRSD